MKKNAVLVLCIIGIVLLTLKSNASDSNEIQENIADKILRFHVIANSDSAEDHALKLMVRDEVITYLSDILKDCNSLDESMQKVSLHYYDILCIAEDVIHENGYNYSVSCNIESAYFPVKSYGDITLPSGNYTALRVTIGNAKGRNWWCILYPPLCFVDASCGVVPDESKAELREILTENEYSEILEHNSNVKFRFKYLTFLNDFISE